MRLVVKRSDKTINKFQFAKGPIYIGRNTNCQIFLPDRSVSRQHAVVFSTQDGKWIVEDLDSANKTYLNDEVIHKSEIKTGDCLHITDFVIEINFEDNTAENKSIHLEDTLVTAPYEPQIIVRRIDVEHAPDMILPSKRAKDFMQAAKAICEANSSDEMLLALLNITLKQFSAYRVWCALRDRSAGPMTCHIGKRRDRQAVLLSEIKLGERITQVVEKRQFLLFPRIPLQIEHEKVRSAMIAPIVSLTGCFGVLYVDNAMDREHYSLSDMDYLMLLSIHTAAIVENF